MLEIAEGKIDELVVGVEEGTELGIAEGMLGGIVQGETPVTEAGHEFWIHVGIEEGIALGIDEGELVSATVC